MPFKPGQSGNKLGRPKGAAGIAKYVAEQTNDGQELIDRLLELSRSARTPIRERLAATTALLDRAVGKALQPSEMVLALSPLPDVERIAAMTPAERLAWLDAERARLRLAPVQALLPAPRENQENDPLEQDESENDEP